jgi:hypothetical protein
VSAAELTLIPEAHAAAGGFKCSELLGDKETTSWVKGVLKLAGGGGSLAFEDGAKAGLPKTSELVSKALGASGDTAKKIGSATSYANTVTRHRHLPGHPLHGAGIDPTRRSWSARRRPRT